MHKLLWLAVLTAVWGCNQPSAPVEPEPKQSVAEFALQPEHKEPSDIRTEHEKNKVKEQKEAEALLAGKEILSEESAFSREKVRELLRKLSFQRRKAFSAGDIEVSSSLTDSQLKTLQADLALAVNARRQDWNEARASWNRAPKKGVFPAPPPVPAAVWNKYFMFDCANKIYQAFDKPAGSLEEKTQSEQVTDPSAFLDTMELKLAQKEEWKKAQKAEWDVWIKKASAQEQYQAFESVVGEILQRRIWEPLWREDWNRPSFSVCSEENMSMKEAENMEFLQSLLSSFPKPWKQTDNSVTFCEEVSGEECVKGAKFVSWREVKGESFSRFETTTVSCQKGFLENGDCRLGYNRITDGAGFYKSVSCDTYFNGKCYGEFRSLEVPTDVMCWVQPAETVIKKSDFDGSWGYYQASGGCEGEHKLWCYRFDPETFVCQDGFYQEVGECTISNTTFSGLMPEGCVPDKDLLSCEIKDGVCVNEKIIKGRSRGKKKGDLWTALGEGGEKAADSEKKKEFRLTLPKEYAFE